MSLLRTLRTAQHLRTVQVVERVRRALFPLHRHPPVEGVYRLVGDVTAPAVWAGPDRFDGSGFTLLGRRRPFEGEARWDPPGAERLWTYHLHYMEALATLPGREGLALVRDWIAHNPGPQGPGWEPYVLSRRIRAWTEWALTVRDLDPAVRAEIAASLAQQTEALAAQLEFHLFGNHLLENAVTLCWAGLRLEGPRSDAWLRRGLGLLEREVRAQTLPDGMHEERTPMYQALLADGLRRLAGVAGGSRAPQAGHVAALALATAAHWTRSLGALVHPDGDYALVNDTALDGAPRHAALVGALGPGAQRDLFDRDAGAGGQGAWSLPAAGYAGWRDTEGTYALFDVGPIGPDHQPGHGHADALAFECSLRGRRVVTDTGVSTYEVGPERAYDRSTAAHSTVQVDGQDQSELWGAFRCARRARILRVDVRRDPAGGVEIEAAYRGPGRSPGGVTHSRRLSLGASGVAGADRIQARGRHRAVARLHLAPGLSVQRRGDLLEIRDEEGVALALVGGEGVTWREGRSPYHPTFGREIDRVVLEAEVPFEDEVAFSWSLRPMGAVAGS